ncbi:MAG: sigma-54-dependent Fis family transcriptional regulator [PS1 clade bacterium]|nr:sigma-54-dependent Fis family transcriptional regulator [PS1 clade bacterium]
MFGDVLIVDDEKDIRDLIAGILVDEGYSPRTAADSDAALREITSRCPSLVLLDVWLQGSRLDGLEVLNILRERYPDLPVIIISGHGNIETAVSAIRQGAYDYIEKPFKSDKLLLTVRRASENARLHRENIELRRKNGIHFELIGQASVIEQLNMQIDKLAQTNSRIMINGPAGSGKEIVAGRLHSRSPRANQNFVTIHSAMMGDDLERIEKMLFGYETEDFVEVGQIEQAHNGTLYLDNIAHFPSEIQGEILKFILKGYFTRVGGNDNVNVDARILSSCSLPPEQLIRDGLLREDLFHRLQVVALDVPGLTKRRDDIPLLVEFYISAIADQINVTPRQAGHDVMAVLQSHNWPGNVRQLRNCVEHMMLNSVARQSDVLTIDMLPKEIVSETDVSETITRSGHIMSLPLREARERFEREYLIAQIDRFSGNVSRTAEFVGMERSALHRKLKSLGIAGSNHAKSHA